jgi:hypothetical protein
MASPFDAKHIMMEDDLFSFQQKGAVLFPGHSEFLWKV